MDILTTPIWWSYLLRLFIFYFIAWIFIRLSNRISHWLIQPLRLKYFPSRRTPERKAALQSLIASTINALSLMMATLLTLGLFVKPDTLIWLVGLFSAAFGLGARPLISDLLAGINFIFEDNFGVGEKIETNGVEGIVEDVKLRTTRLRGNQGDLYIIPNGEITTVRNFSRSRFSRASVKLKLHTFNLDQAIAILEDLGQEAIVHLPNLLEPWEVISEDNEVSGQKTEIILVVKAKFGKAAVMRPRLLAFVQKRLNEVNIELVD